MLDFDGNQGLIWRIIEEHFSRFTRIGDHRICVVRPEHFGRLYTECSL